MSNTTVAPLDHVTLHEVFPSTGMQTFSCCIHFLGVSLLAHCLSRRANLTSIRAILDMSWARVCVMLLFIDSWAFLFTSGVLIFGVGLEYSSAVCSTAIYLCIACYGTSKLCIYAFLIERIHVVWHPSTGVKRRKSPVYIICALTVACYPVIAILMLVGRIHYFRGDGSCMVGLSRFSSIPLLTFDFYINIFLTSLFLWPLLRSKFLNPRVKRVAVRTLLCALVALTTSSINIAFLTLMLHQLGWVCLASCGSDIILNAMSVYWVTGGAATTVKPAAPTQAGTVDYAPSRRPLEFSSKGMNFDDKTNEVANVYDYLPRSRDSGVGKIVFMPRTNSQKSDEVSGSPPKSPGFLQSLTANFRREPAPPKDGVQITVTTEFEMKDRSDTETDGDPASHEAETDLEAASNQS